MRDKFRRFTIMFAYSAFTLILVLFIVISKYYFNAGIICPLKAFFSIDCPGCGGTRMAVAILHFDFYQAFRFNPFIFATFPILLVVYIWQFVAYVKDNRLLKYLDTFLWVYAFALVIFGVIRNIPIFSFLAPTVV